MMKYQDGVYSLDVTATDDEAAPKKQGISGYGTELVISDF